MRILREKIVFMDKKITAILNRPLYPYLYALLFIIFKSAQYYPSFSPLTVLNVFILYGVITYLLLTIFKRIGNPAYAGILSIICWASLLHVVGIAMCLGFDYAYIPLYFYISFYVSVVVFLLVVLWLLSKLNRKYAQEFNRVLNIFMLISCFVFALHGKWINSSRHETKRNIAQWAQAAGGNGKDAKDIVWILMDEYGSSKVLNSQFAFNNPMDDELKKQGFCILDSIKTRFNNTLFSLNAIFNEDDSTRPVNFYSGVASLRSSILVPYMQANGYHFINLSSFDISAANKIADRSGYPQTYLDQLLSGTLFSMIGEKFKYTISKCDQYNQQLVRMLEDSLSAPSAQNRFIWTHLMIPHEPFCRNRNGQLISPKEYSAGDSTFTRGNYINYLEYGNNVLLKLLDKNPVMKNKIIIISGDHGPRYGFIKDKTTASHPFAAIYIPEKYDTSALQHLTYISAIPKFLLEQHL